MRGSHRRLAVTVDSPSGRWFLDLPEDARVDDLIPALVEVCEAGTDPAGWSLAAKGEATLAGERTVGESGLYPGAVLLLVAPAEPAPHEPGLPSASHLARRLKAAIRPAAHMPEIDRMSDAGYRRLLDDAITAPGRGAGMVVAVISARTGAGATTVTALLATLLNTLRREDEVAAVDACPQSGALSHWMAPESAPSVAAYSSLLEPASTPEQVQTALIRIGPGLAILPVPSDQRSKPAGDEEDWARLIEHLRHMHNLAILDCGAGFERPVNRAALGAADVVVLVSRSTPGELERLGATIRSIRNRGRNVILVANQAARRARASRSIDGVQQLTLAQEPQPAHRLKTRGFSWSDAPDSWQEPMRELAAALIGSAQGSAQPKP